MLGAEAVGFLYRMVCARADADGPFPQIHSDDSLSFSVDVYSASRGAATDSHAREGGTVIKSSVPRIGVASALLAALCLALPTAVGAVSFHVTFDTSAVAGQTGTLVFDFIDGDAAGGGVGNNTATVAPFSPTAALLPGSSSTGGVTGTLNPGPLTLSDSESFNEFLQPLLLGAAFDFTVVVTEDVRVTVPPSTIPDQFSFLLLDASGTPFPTTDPDGTDLLAIVGADATTELFALKLQAVAVPAPSTLTLVFGFGALWILSLVRPPSRSSSR